MSHELEIIDGKAQMAYAGETPWHGLGKQVSGDLTPAQMLVEAGLDWKVRTRPCFTMIDEKRVRIGKQALVRESDNKILDVISDDWKPMQNEDALAFFNDFVAAGEMTMETAGSLKGGKLVWALAKTNESFELFCGKDRVEGYLHFTNPHSYGQSIDVRFTPIRVVCNNTLTLSLSTASKAMAKWNHRREFDEELVKETLGIAHDKLQKYKEMAQHLSKKRFTQENIVDYFARIFPVSAAKQAAGETSRNTKAAIEDYLESQPGAELGQGTWWQAFNTVTYMADHVLGRSQDTRLTSAWYGHNRQMKQNALELALELAA